MKNLKFLFLSILLLSIAACGKDDDDGSGERMTDSFSFGDTKVENFETRAFKSNDGLLITIDFGQEDRLTIVCADTLSGTYSLERSLKFETNQSAFILLSGSIEGATSDGIINIDIVDEDSLFVTFDVAFASTQMLKESKVNKVKIQNQPFVDFTQISPTDDNGGAIGNKDESDWKSDDVWIDLERALFRGTGILDINTSDTLEVYSAYPNPLLNNFFFSFRANQVVQKIYIVLVNSNFEIIHEGTIDTGVFGVGFNNILFSSQNVPALDAIEADEYFRMYYVIEFENSTFRGHGDLVKFE